MMRVGSENCLAVLAMVERRQQLALGQVAGAAEDDEVERLDRDDLAAHGLSTAWAACARPVLSNRFKFASAMVSHAVGSSWNLTAEHGTRLSKPNDLPLLRTCSIGRAAPNTKGEYDGKAFRPARHRRGDRGDAGHRRPLGGILVGAAHRRGLPVGWQGVRLHPGLRRGRCRPGRAGGPSRLRQQAVEPDDRAGARTLAHRAFGAAVARGGRHWPHSNRAIPASRSGKAKRTWPRRVRYFEFYGGAADKIHGETMPFLDGYTALTLREPHGVVGRHHARGTIRCRSSAASPAPRSRWATRWSSSRPRTPR